MIVRAHRDFLPAYCVSHRKRSLFASDLAPITVTLIFCCGGPTGGGTDADAAAAVAAAVPTAALSRRRGDSADDIFDWLADG